MAGVTPKGIDPHDERLKQEMAEDRKQAVLLRAQAATTTDQPILTGFEDEFTRDLVLANHQLRQARVASLKPILPLLLRLKGKPYKLHNYFPFEPFFRTRMAKTTLLKTGRQVSKSTSLAAQGVVFSNSIPYFSTLYVTPLFEMIRRFSHNYVREFIDQSPVARLFTGTKTTNQILQRSFKNGSAMYFSYAFLDAERTRGIPADKNCLVAGTRVLLADGRRIPIEHVLIGSDVVSADKNGTITLDRVTDNIFQGVRRVYEVMFDDGRTVRCTADERFLAESGEWTHLTNFIDGPPTVPGRTARLLPDADAVRVLARGCDADQVQRNLVVASRFPPRHQAGGVLPAQSGEAVGIRFDAPDTRRQPGVGLRVRDVRDGVEPGVQCPGKNRRPGREKIRDAGVGLGARLGGDRVLADGRRHATDERLAVLHTRIFGAGIAAAGPPAGDDGARFRKARAGHRPQQTKTGRAALARRLPGAVDAGLAVRPRDPSVQTRPAETDSRLLRLSENVPLSPGPTDRGAAGMQDAVLLRGAAAVTAGGKCRTARIVSVTCVGERPVWDLNTRTYHAFSANGVVVHNCIDEVQDMNYDFLQIIHETLSGSPWGLKQYAGTPKSLDNTMEKLWGDSSQAEWVIRCQKGGCNHWNVPASDWDLLDMIGPWHRDISEQCPGVVCALCRTPLNPRTGRWVHRYPERRWTMAGYHVPQIIMPMHYANHEKWDTLVGKMQGRANTTPTTFLNEVCGESCDAGSKLITKSDIMAACTLPWKCRAAEATKHIRRYVYRILAVDWGGGGGTVKGGASKNGEQKRERTSFTSMAVLGVTPDGKVDVIWGHRSVRTHDWEYEANLCLEAMKLFKCSHIAHDYSGAGEGRLVLLYQSGLPPTNIINVRYQGFGHALMNFHEATDDHPHDWYAVDKSRSLVTTCMAIKHGLIRFFQYDYVSADQTGLLEDFLALIEEKVDSRLGSDTYVIVRNPNKSDDFAHAVNMGACCLWWMTKKWPNIAEAAKFKIPPHVLKHVHPVARVDWDDL